jgi:hypothetical protein
MTSGMLSVLATCGTASGSSRVFGIVIPPLIAALWGWGVWQVAGDVDKATRLKLFSVFVVAAVSGAAIFPFPHGPSGNSIAGDVFLPGGAILLFVWALALSGDCLD